MYAEIKVYDGEVKELIKRLDDKARKFDKGKYGLPPNQHLETIVYNWIYEQSEKYKKEKEKTNGN